MLNALEALPRTPSRPAQVCRELLELRPDIVRGNPSEIMALAGVANTTKGVDSTAGGRGTICSTIPVLMQYRYNASNILMFRGPRACQMLCRRCWG